MQAVVGSARTSIRPLYGALSMTLRWRLCRRNFSDDIGDINSRQPGPTVTAPDAQDDAQGGAAGISAEDATSQIEAVGAIIEDVEADHARKVEEARASIPTEPTFGELFANLGLKDTNMESWFKMQQFQEEELPILEELSPREIKLREKAKRRAEEMRKVKELADSRVRIVNDEGQAHAIGKRKTSKASVYLEEGEGRIRVNGMSYDLYFKLLDHRVHILEPFCETDTLGKFNVKARVHGGGISGQAGAVRLGISRALQLFDPALRPPLRSGGYLTRDPRVVERKKPGKAKARKSFQWVKR